jgi:hypothetical protein
MTRTTTRRAPARRRSTRRTRRPATPAGKRAPRDAAIREYRAAKASLARYRCAGETPEYYRRNNRVIAAYKNPDLPWWFRWFLA